MSYESYLAGFAEAIFAKAEDASFEDFNLAGNLWELGELIWDKAMKAAAHGA